MSARPRAKTAHTVHTVQIPPMALMVATFADHQEGAHHGQFAEAYAQVPAMVQSIVDDKVGRLGHIHQNTILAAMLDAEIARSRDATAIEEYDSGLAAAMDAMDAAYPEARARIEVALGLGGFYLGLAFASYLLTSGTAVGVKSDGESFTTVLQASLRADRTKRGAR